MFVTPAFAQTSPFGGDSMWVQLLPFVLIFVIMYLLILRPQQKRAKEHQELIKNLRRGDTVITSGGLVGKVTKAVSTMVTDWSRQGRAGETTREAPRAEAGGGRNVR